MPEMVGRRELGSLQFVPAGSASWHRTWTVEHLEHDALPLWLAVAHDGRGRDGRELLAAISIRGRAVLERHAERCGATLTDRASDHPPSRAAAQLLAYRDGARDCFDLALLEHPDVTSPFERHAWRALCAIPFGETRSYGQQAAMIGKPSAARAVGRANGRNPYPVVVPCHRVVGSDGTLTGFTGGLPLKRWLLAREGRPGGEQLALAL